MDSLPSVVATGKLSIKDTVMTVAESKTLFGVLPLPRSLSRLTGEAANSLKYRMMSFFKLFLFQFFLLNPALQHGNDVPPYPVLLTKTKGKSTKGRDNG